MKTYLNLNHQTQHTCSHSYTKSQFPQTDCIKTNGGCNQRLNFYLCPKTRSHFTTICQNPRKHQHQNIIKKWQITQSYSQTNENKYSPNQENGDELQKSAKTQGRMNQCSKNSRNSEGKIPMTFSRNTNKKGEKGKQHNNKWEKNKKSKR